MERMLVKLKWQRNITNVALADWSMNAIWVGSSLFQMHLRIMKDLVEFKRKKNWQWDYFINLSEADMPLKYLNYYKINRVFIFILYLKDQLQI